MKDETMRRALLLLLSCWVVSACKERKPAPATQPAQASASAAAGESPALPPGAPPLAAERPARLAGAWYDKDPQQLARSLSRWLEEAREQEGAKAPRGPLYGLVAPHAGYRFSGRTAASAYALLREAKPRRVFLIGPSHTSRVRGVALVWAERFVTPGGSLAIDTRALAQLARHPLFVIAPRVDAREHSVEMQMPFIHQVAPKARVVPLIAGALTLHEVRRVADAIGALLRPGDVVVASSDFTHYGPSYGYVPFGAPVEPQLRALDMRAYRLLAAGDLPAFWRFKHETADTICGFYPLSILRALVGDAEGTLLRYDTSGRVLSDFENSVSYLAVAFSGKPGARAGWAALRARQRPTPELLADGAAERAVTIARRTLEHHFSGTKTRFDPRAAELVTAGPLEQVYGVFVTLKRKDDNSLRGCIGHVIGRVPLYRGIVDNALNAAFHDPRFAPLRKEELAAIRVEVTVLTPPRAVDGPQAITLGRDGVILQKGDKQALFLPQVAVEQGWGLERTLGALSRKAGLPLDGWHGARFFTFEGYVYEEHDDGAGG